MKRLLLTILCLLFTYPCFAGEPIQLAMMNPWVAGSVVNETPCSIMGSQETTGGSGSSTAGYLFGNLITVSGTCYVNKVYYYAYTDCAAGDVKLAVYATSGGHPTGDPIAISDEIPFESSSGWYSANITKTTLNAGTYALIASSASVCVYFITGSDEYMSYDSSNYPTNPFTTWSGTSTSSSTISMYIRGE